MLSEEFDKRIDTGTVYYSILHIGSLRYGQSQYESIILEDITARNDKLIVKRIANRRASLNESLGLRDAEGAMVNIQVIAEGG